MDRIYHGWQRQSNAISVQQVLEEALSRLARKVLVFWEQAGPIPVFMPFKRF